jgi:hypothetical protein
VGLLAPDVWARSRATLDVRGGVLLLREVQVDTGSEAAPGGVAPGASEPEDPP